MRRSAMVLRTTPSAAPAPQGGHPDGCREWVEMDEERCSALPFSPPLAYGHLPQGGDPDGYRERVKMDEGRCSALPFSPRPRRGDRSSRHGSALRASRCDTPSVTLRVTAPSGREPLARREHVDLLWEKNYNSLTKTGVL